MSMTSQQKLWVLQLFGKTAFRPGQLALIEAALNGENALGVLPTGHGKSLCYQAAAVLLDGVSVVVSPLIALMRDQVSALSKLGISSARLDSTLDAREREEVLSRIADGKLRLLFVAPESLESDDLEKALASCAQLSLFVVDEAHCVSEWGHSFRPDYLRLPSWRARFPFRCVMALTATATPRVRDDLCRAFSIACRNRVVLPPYRPNIERCAVATEDRLPVLKSFLEQGEHLPAIVYTRTRKGAEELAGELRREGWRDVACYHAGMPSEQREKLQDDFLENRLRILVATIAFGMGVDKPDVRSVVHFDAPSSPESYLQESGRAGRDGNPAWSMVMLQSGDLRDARNRIMAAEPDAEGVLRCARWLAPQARRVVSLWELETVCDIADDVPLRMLDMLKSRGFVREEARGSKYYKARPLFPLSSILCAREETEAERLRWLDLHREGEVEAAAEAWDCTFAEAMEQLRECEAAGEWKLAWRQQAICLQTVTSFSPKQVAEELSESFACRRAANRERFETLLEMLSSPCCINQSLHRYFMREEAPACGHCSGCARTYPSLPPDPPPYEPSFCTEDLPDFARPSQRRRFLLGLPSPGLLARRLWSHPLYGAAKEASWDDLL